MHFYAKKIDSIITLYKNHFTNERDSFEHSIQTLTKNWRESGFVLDSLLTPGKIPIEFSCNFNSPSLSYTVDPGLASNKAAEKWQTIENVVGSQIQTLKPNLEPYISCKGQRYGCWLSVRHTGKRIGYKVYQEVTREQQAQARKEITKVIPQLNLFHFETKLIGINVSENNREYYLNFRLIDEPTLFEIMKIAGVEKLCSFFTVQLAALKGANYKTIFNEVNVGVSFKVDPTHSPILSLFFHAPELFMNNQEAFYQVNKFGEGFGDTKFYQQFTQNVLYSKPKYPIHSVLSFKFKEDDYEFSIGISP